VTVLLILACFLQEHSEIQQRWRELCSRLPRESDRAYCLTEMPMLRGRRAGDWLIDLSGFAVKRCGDASGVYYYQKIPWSLEQIQPRP